MFPPGHFHSPIPDLDEVRRDEALLFGPPPASLPGIDMREDEQLALLRQFAALYPDIPFADEPRPGLRYHYLNPAYSFSDAIMLHCMLRTLRPRQLVEVGSGYSSCVTLDTNQYFLDQGMKTTFIDPNPHMVNSLLRAEDFATTTILPQTLQTVDLAVFTALRENDVLFIDSTHVGKIGSDVNRLLFEIFPALAPGVVIHIHDIFYPFEYPKEWVQQGIAWNEAYMMRAFLQYNDRFQVMLMNTYLAHYHREFFAEHMPDCLRNTGGSLWLRKVG
jgi:hypothetical protein